MRAGLLWAAVVAVGLLTPLGIANAAECNDLGTSARSVTYVMDSPAPYLLFDVELNVSVDAPNSTVVSPNSTVVFMGGTWGASHVCVTMDSPPSAATVASPPRPPPEPNWPDVTSLTTDFLSSSAVKVYWRTNIPTVGRVVWGPWGDRPIGTAESEVFATAHGVWIRGLTPGETYEFHVIVFDARTHAELSEEFELTTPLPPRDHSSDALLVAASAMTTLGLCYAMWRRNP